MFSFHDLFNLYTQLNSGKGEAGSDLLSYLAWSEAPNFDNELCYEDMLSRVDHSTGNYNYTPQEAPIFAKRFKVLRTKNKFYMISVKQNPSVSEVEEASYIEPCFSTLMPIRNYIVDHPHMAKDYHGCLPFGKPVILYYNMYSTKPKIKGTPDFKAHVDLKDWSNNLSLFFNIPSAAVNLAMYLEGRKLLESNNAEDLED